MWREVLGWAQAILGLAVVFSLVALLLPPGALRGTVRAVMGVCLLAAVLGPVVGLVEDAGRWEQAMGRWSQPDLISAGAGRPGEGPALVGEGAEEAMAARALEALTGPLGRALTAALEGVGYEALEVRVRPAAGGQLAVDARVRRRSALAMPEERLPAYLAAVAGLEEGAVELHVEQ